MFSVPLQWFEAIEKAEKMQGSSGKPGTVLLAGSARGGTTWALKVLDSHPAVCGCHEPFYQLSSETKLQNLFERFKSGEELPEDAEILLTHLIRGCVQTHKPPFFAKEFLRTPAAIRNLAWLAARAFGPAGDVFRYLSTGDLNSGHRVVFKNRPFPNLDRILRALKSDVIILLRHPCGVVSSWLKGIEMGIMEARSSDNAAVWSRYSTLLEPIGITERQLSRMSPAGVLAVNWLVDTLLFREYENIGLRTQTVVYCDLVRNPIPEWSRVFEWMGLSMCPSVESFLQNSSQSLFDFRKLLGKKYTYFSVKRSDSAPLTAWKKHLSPDQVAEISDIVVPHFDVHRYWPESFPASPAGKAAPVSA